MPDEPRIIGQTAGPAASDDSPPEPAGTVAPPLPAEVGGRDGPEPTRYGDWEKNGRCIDF